MALSFCFNRLMSFNEGVGQAPEVVPRWSRDSTVKAEGKWGMTNWKTTLHGHEQCSQLGNLLEPFHGFSGKRLCTHHFLLRALIICELSDKLMNGKTMFEERHLHFQIKCAKLENAHAT